MAAKRSAPVLAQTSQSALYKAMLSVDDSYARAGHDRRFVGFLRQRGFGVTEQSLRAYANHLNDEHDGRRLGASTVNVLMAAAKARIRYLLSTIPTGWIRPSSLPWSEHRAR